jgi:hypothetical protein
VTLLRSSELEAIMLRFVIVLSLGIIAGCSSSTQVTDAAAANDVGSGSDGTVAIDGGHALDANGGDTGTAADGASNDAASNADAPSDDAASTVDAGSDDAASGDAGGSLNSCGGFAGAVCTSTEYCQYTGPVTCGAADGTGVCRARPTSCAPDTNVVCGCDFMTYANACEAARAGTDVSASGSCGAATTFACGPAIRCTADTQYCRITMGGFAHMTSYSCEALATCTAGTTPSCASCFPGSTVGNMCNDVGPGEMTVTLLTP